ncbi:MAG: heavy metal-binding domain-containing protein, partial [Planctomycetota bacterium]
MKKLLFSYLWISVLLPLFPLSAQHNHNNETPEHSEMKGVLQKLGKEYLRVAIYIDQDVFWCPMDCEQGKMYNEKGTCPVCNMNLIPQQSCYLEIFLLNADQKTSFPIPSNTLTVELTFANQKTPKKITLQSALLNKESKESCSHFIGSVMLPKDLDTLTLKVYASFGVKDAREATVEVKTEKLIHYPVYYCLLTNEKI